MADTKGSALPSMTTPAGSDILIAVDDPGGTPATQQVSFADAWANYFKSQADGLYLTSVATGDIADDAVTFAKLQDATQEALIGAGAAGAFQEITLGANMTLSGGVLDSTGGTDSAAIHDNVSGEIAAVTEKVSPVAADLIIIEDSAASNAKKKVQLGNIGDALASEVTSSPQTTLADDDYLMVLDPDDGTLSDRETSITYANLKSELNADLSFVPATVTPNAQTGTAYTLVLTDQNKLVTMDNSSANTLTVPTNAAVAFPVGAVVGVTQLGLGATTVEGDTGVTVNGVSAGSGALSAQYAGAVLTKIATDAWLLQGDHGGVS